MSIKNCEDNSLQLYRYFGNEEILEDTGSRVQGLYKFSSEEPFVKGLYKISWQNNKHFLNLFLVNSNPFQVECDSRNIIGTIKIVGSEENAVLYDYLAFIKEHRKNQTQPEGNDTLAVLLKSTDFTNTAFIDYSNTILSKYPFLLSVKFLKAFITPKTLAITEQNSKKKTLPSQLLKKHYFDNYDFGDPWLAASPAFISLADTYFDECVEPEADSIKVATDRLLILSSKNKESEKTITWLLALKFGNHYYLPGYDEAYVHIIDKYLEPGKIPWYYPETKDRDITRAKQLKILFLGNPAPDMVMPDIDNANKELNKVNATYTLLLFWASTCSHCRDEMPKIIATYKNLHTPHNFEIFAVSTDTSVTRWKNYIRRYNLPWINVFGRKAIKGDYFELYHVQSTPTLFLLDEKKRIIAKYITVSDLDKYITKQESRSDGY